MKRHRTILWIGLTALLLTAGVFFMAFPREPVMQGRTLSQWIDDIEPAYRTIESSPEKNRNAIQAVRGLGTNAVSDLIRQLEIEDTWLRNKWNQSAGGIPWFNVRLDSAKSSHQKALTGLWALGPVAEPALPALELHVHKNGAHGMAFRTMGAIGCSAFPTLTNLYGSTMDAETRMMALGTMGSWLPGQCEELTIPFMLEVLETADPEWTKLVIAWSLAKTGAHEEQVVPWLVKGLRYPENDSRARSARSLTNYPASARQHIDSIQRLAGDPDRIASDGAKDLLQFLENNPP